MSKKNSKKAGQQTKNNLNLNWIKYTSIILAVLLLIYLLFPFEEKNKKSEEEDPNKMNYSDVFTFKKQGELTFSSQSGDFIRKIDIEIADTHEKRMTGLMYRDKMKEDQGMLFLFPLEELQSFWMKNTIMSLDILFVNSSNEIVKIHKNTTPYSEQSYPSLRPSQYVVEVIGGFTEKYNINEGDKIIWRRL